MSNANAPSILVPGGLNTDIVLSGLPRLLKEGELGTGQQLRIGPGGKSRNIAQMIAGLVPEGTVAMMGRTCRDAYGLWEAPFKALEKAGVDVSHVQVDDAGSGELPGIALIPVDQSGQNQIYLYPGANARFSVADIAQAETLFSEAGERNGILALSLEMPLPTALAAVRMAVKHGLKVVLDPGGMNMDAAPAERAQYEELLRSGVSILKANEHEAKALSGVEVTNADSAGRAAAYFRDLGVPQTIITAGEHGAYAADAAGVTHVPVPEVTCDKTHRDATGCGDQSMAALCAELQSGTTYDEAVRTAVRAGTLQFFRAGIQPLTRADMEQQA